MIHWKILVWGNSSDQKKNRAISRMPCADGAPREPREMAIDMGALAFARNGPRNPATRGGVASSIEKSSPRARALRGAGEGRF